MTYWDYYEATRIRLPRIKKDAEWLAAEARYREAAAKIAVAQAEHDLRLAIRRKHGAYPYGKRRLRKSYWLNGWRDGAPEA